MRQLTENDPPPPAEEPKRVEAVNIKEKDIFLACVLWLFEDVSGNSLEGVCNMKLCHLLVTRRQGKVVSLEIYRNIWAL